MRLAWCSKGSMCSTVESIQMSNDSCVASKSLYQRDRLPYKEIIALPSEGSIFILLLLQYNNQITRFDMDPKESAAATAEYDHSSEAYDEDDEGSMPGAQRVQSV
mmetsp:Transcript_9205/g.7672  ORF Transcript_9205/g.7672 Transcript_9205/m.7672 type:complete len:105 (+) Transcript_9205:3-317(+)